MTGFNTSVRHWLPLTPLLHIQTRPEQQGTQLPPVSVPECTTAWGCTLSGFMCGGWMWVYCPFQSWKPLNVRAAVFLYSKERRLIQSLISFESTSGLWDFDLHGLKPFNWKPFYLLVYFVFEVSLDMPISCSPSFWFCVQDQPMIILWDRFLYRFHNTESEVTVRDTWRGMYLFSALFESEWLFLV